MSCLYVVRSDSSDSIDSSDRSDRNDRSDSNDRDGRGGRSDISSTKGDRTNVSIALSRNAFRSKS